MCMRCFIYLWNWISNHISFSALTVLVWWQEWHLTRKISHSSNTKGSSWIVRSKGVLAKPGIISVEIGRLNISRKVVVSNPYCNILPKKISWQIIRFCVVQTYFLCENNYVLFCHAIQTCCFSVSDVWSGEYFQLCDCVHLDLLWVC